VGLNLVLIDTSVWVDHLNRGDSGVTELLRARRCPMHNFVLGEIALGNLPQWDAKVAWLRRLRPADPIEPPAFLTLLAELSLQGSGSGSSMHTY
jgi:predicted nucleic acid-binding protein